MHKKILIANRGEIAVRIIRACKELGIGCVAVYSTADQDSLHVKLADESVCIGPASSRDSYLNINNVISAAIATGCNAIHPGYGFLSENAKLATIAEKCNIKFIGPSSDVLSKLGNKAIAKQIAIECQIPVVEGSPGPVEDFEVARKVANSIGYPILLKAVNGGGGKGISVIHNENELTKMYDTTCLETETNFGNKKVYIEKYIENPRHIEIQIIADKFGNIVYLGERECSIQRRNQKLIEETPSTFVSDDLRKRLGEDAVALAKAVGYQNTGTVEFIVDQKGSYYFIEMNPRIQVEHPVTEMVTEFDIVKEQIKIAYDNQLSIQQADVKINGHAIECRIYAEDPRCDFRPSPGLIKNLIIPGGFGVRVDTHLYNDYVVPPYYDSLLAKLIVHAPTRREAIKKMRCALEQFFLDGINTNLEYQYLIMHNTDFVRGSYTTNFINEFQQTLRDDYYV